MFVEYLALFLMFMMVVAFICALIYIPIMIANARGICGTMRTAIIVLAWLGIFFGVTWFVALIMALVWDGDVTYIRGEDNLDKLAKLSKLYRDKAITKPEYEKLKKKLLQE